ncbi:membrane protein insertion efficiency factor YidD [Moraxella sp. Tifton1]|nr:membrane protein insertion efficiency factor YidD [Moraxella sp. Tifton1]
MMYQKVISPIIPARCRYYPTCSHYARQALTWHRLGRGLVLVLRRLLSCHPWGGHGVDFVPVPMYGYYYDIADEVYKTGLGVLVDDFSYVARLNWLMRK